MWKLCLCWQRLLLPPVSERKAPDACATMAELRPQIDALDVALVALLAERKDYIDRAISLKQNEKLPARITSRVGEVIDNVRRQAVAHELDPDLTDALWTHLIEWSIAREAKQIPE